VNDSSGDDEERDVGHKQHESEESGSGSDSTISIDNVVGHEEDEWEILSSDSGDSDSGSAEKPLYLGKVTEKIVTSIIAISMHYLRC
jgi:hypothetical protein